MSEIAEKLQSLPLFNQLNSDQVEYFLKESRERSLEEGDHLFEQDDESNDCFYVVAEGSIGIEKFMRNDRELVASMEPGDFFGELGLFSGGKRLAGTVATEPSTVLEVSQSTVGKMKAEYPEALIAIYEKMFESLSGRFNALAQKAEKTQFWL